MEQHYLEKLCRTLERNNFWTSLGAISGTIIGIIALVIAIIALLK